MGNEINVPLAWKQN